MCSGAHEGVARSIHSKGNEDAFVGYDKVNRGHEYMAKPFREGKERAQREVKAYLV